MPQRHAAFCAFFGLLACRGASPIIRKERKDRKAARFRPKMVPLRALFGTSITSGRPKDEPWSWIWGGRQRAEQRHSAQQEP